MVYKAKASIKNTLLIAHEISLVKFLCSNEQSVRHRGLQKLRRWLTSRSQGIIELREDDFNRLWKGLFYCVWMADKPLYQEEVIEMTTQLINCFVEFSMSVTFIKSFFNILGQEWYGIDHLRMDKCLMLIRRFIRQNFTLLKKNNWNVDNVKLLSNCYCTCLNNIPDGLTYHFADVYVNELAKVGDGQPSGLVVVELVKPFAEQMSRLNHGQLISHIASVVFLNLIRQSDEGLDHEARFKAWKDRGFVGGTIDVIKKVDIDDNEEDEEEEDCNYSIESNDNIHNNNNNHELDPRAGHVDVELPRLNFDCQQMIVMFNSLKSNKLTTTKARKQIASLISKFSSLMAGKYPLGLQKLELPNKINWKSVIRNTAEKLIDFQKNECTDNNEDSCSSLVDSVAAETIVNGKFGKWQVTPVKNSKSTQSSLQTPNSLIKWEIIETQDTNNKNIRENENNKLKRKLFENSFSFNNTKKKVKINNMNDDFNVEETSDTEIVIKQRIGIRERKRRKKKKDISGYRNTGSIKTKNKALQKRKGSINA
ncbi:ribosomal RNA processing protein 1 homolog Nnp-1 isoform X2 [Lycorma delicatula]|uniref:ribosomal RNA processing protein 1 homolog Nnp-1 isoform X2 n=1 Tax=Lycorma delicatula TaxID=130591 RepID=UPI003F514452